MFSLVILPKCKQYLISNAGLSRSLSTLTAIFGITFVLAVSGCSQPDNKATITASDSQATDSIETSTMPSGSMTSTVPNIESNAEGTSPDSAAGKPVSYDIQSWQKEDVETFDLEDLTNIQRIFGKVTVTDENSLDYASNLATKYRFMEGAEPYLDILDSQSYLEFGWYFANPNDSESEKEISINHAKKVYTVANSLMGSAGGDLVAKMLSGQIIKNKEVGKQHVELAKCEFYSCMLVIKKPEPA